MVKKLRKTLGERLQGRYTKKSVKNPTTGEVIRSRYLITEDMAAAIATLVRKEANHPFSLYM